MALVVFLRGVNVGGHRRFRPSLLAQQLERYEVASLGAAGTFVIRAPVGQAQLRAELRRRLPFETEIMICRGRQLVDAAGRHPFGEGPPRRGVVRFMSILARAPRRPRPTPISLPPGRSWLVRILAAERRFLFGEYRRTMRTIGTLDTMDRIFGVRITTRNWNTIRAIVELLA